MTPAGDIRDDPPAPDPRRFEPAQIAARLGAAAAKRIGITDSRRRHNLGRMLLVLLDHPRQTRTQLADALNLSPDTAADIAQLLLATSLLRDGWHQGRWHWYALSRAGEDWALPIVQDEAPLAAR